MILPITLIQGPGSHSHLIEKFLGQNYENWDTFSYWPKFQFTQVENGEKSRYGNVSYDLLWYLLHGINHRLLRYSNGRQFHRRFLYSMYDELCRLQINEPKLLIAWSQMALKSMRKNRQLGGKNVLEHPMPHVEQWMSVNQQFYNDPAILVKPGYSRFSPGMVSRMVKEYSEADYIQVHSSFARKTFMDHGIPDSKIIVTHLALDPSLFRFINTPKIRADKVTFLYVGRLELWKGVHLLLQCAERIGPANMELVLVGNVLPEMQPYLERYKGNKRILGPLNKEDLSMIYKRSDILVLPSLNDAFGMVILEAMAHGLPVIASTASAGPDILVNGENGLLIEAGDVENLHDAMAWAIEHRDKLLEMGDRAKKTVDERYLPQHYFQNLTHQLRLINFA
jgi:glycosyltransferase involved in cell wall biosynthesis